MPAVDIAWLLERLLHAARLAATSGAWDSGTSESWWSYVRADERSEEFRRYLADGLTRTLVAARAKEMSARTGGLILVQLLLDLSRAGARADRVLDSPTSDAWIGPWVALPARGAASRCGWGRASRVCSCATAGSWARRWPGGRSKADYYVAALPVEIMRGLLSPELRAAEPRLERPRPACHALDERDHVLRLAGSAARPRPRDLPGLEWALTSISQRQFWRGVDFDQLGIGGVLSVDISEWQRAGRVQARSRRSASPEEIRDEVWAQLQRPSRGRADGVELRSGSSTRRSSSPTPRARRTPSRCSSTPRARGPTAPTPPPRIPNLMLASDYVRTFTDLATMEGANEAARRGQRNPRSHRLIRAPLRALALPRAPAPAPGPRPRQAPLPPPPPRPTPIRVTPRQGQTRRPRRPRPVAARQINPP